MVFILRAMAFILQAQVFPPQVLQPFIILFFPTFMTSYLIRDLFAYPLTPFYPNDFPFPLV